MVPLLVVGEMADAADGDSFAPGRSGVRPPWLASAETYSSGWRFGRRPGIGSERLGMNGAPGVGVGLPANPMPRPEIGGNTDSGEFVAGLSRADLLKGGASYSINSNVNHSFRTNDQLEYLQRENLRVASWYDQHPAEAKRLVHK